ncbi:chromosome segregation protein SMC [Methylobacterium sp. P1-11]|uniref:ATP-binding protein n=1 Tax=Methylobacterium sp. P1-11 TaxID=2024616 RepID=UPI0011EEDCC9|nr:YhaN family protein [Methylobacterium sp. P1-11]KAA0124440.1 chromosome segregation protein SMC [Methylobacterium sp. P1-11]
MRLIRLALERYGAFTDRTVEFRPDARLHVVVGANEAGKSTALAAVTDLLFGFGKTTPYAFLHDMPQLRLGAEIAAADGRRLSFRRRKGNSRTLIDAAEAPLPDDALAPFLGGLSRTVFCRAFGLDAASLRAGGREMVDVEGEVGASLFAAGSGLRGLTELQTTLDQEADAIFAPRQAKHRTFYQALERHELARRAIRERSLRAGDWRALNDEIAAAAAQLETLRAEQKAITVARARLERLKRVRPMIAEIDALEQRIAVETDLVDADSTWIARLGAALDACRTAEAEAARAEAALERNRSEAEAVPVEPGLTHRADEILAAFSGTKEFEKGGTDLPRIEGDAHKVGLELERLRARIGLPDLTALEARQPPDAVRVRIERLIREGRTFAAAEDQLARDLAAARIERERLNREVEAADAARDPSPLREALKPLVRLHEWIAARDTLDATIRREAALLRNQAERLSPPVADLAVLVRTPLPAPDTVANYRQRLDAKTREHERAADRRDAVRRQVAVTRARLREREAGRPIATRERLDAVRASRDAAFAPLRDALAAGRSAGIAEIAAFERALIEADRVADERASDAARVAAHAVDLERLATEEAEAVQADNVLAGLAAEIAAGEAAWRDAWRPAGLVPGPPAEMAAWLAEVESLIEAEQRLAEQQIEADRLGTRIEAARAPLADLRARAGLDAAPELEIAAALEGLEVRVATLASRWEANLQTGGLLRAAQAATGRLEAALAEAAARRAAWQTEWAAALLPLGLDSEAAPEEAEGALEAWRNVPDRLAERAALQRRSAGIRRDMEAFRVTAAALVAALAPDLVDAPPAGAIRTLHGRLVAAQAREARRVELDRRRDEAEAAHRSAAEHRDSARALLLRHVAEAMPDLAAAPISEIDRLFSRMSEREKLRAERLRLRGSLAGAADGLPEAELRAGLETLPPEAIEAELARLALEADEQAERGQVIFADRDRAERRRAELEGGTGAELALAERKAAEADLQEAARSWAVLRLAGLMLGQAVARHRAGQQDPLVARAGALFHALTGGGFSGLAQIYDEADTPKLAGQRAGGGTVAIEGMSEGTRDQLYLALRLAYLEDYAGRAEPAPFIGDDLFSTFDETRTGYGLDALAEIGTRVQPILFTHHRHVAEIARDRLGAAVDVVAL